MSSSNPTNAKAKALAKTNLPKTGLSPQASTRDIKRITKEERFSQILESFRVQPTSSRRLQGTDLVYDEVKKIIDALNSNKNIQKITFSGCRLSQDSINALANAGKLNENITHLGIEDNRRFKETDLQVIIDAVQYRENVQEMDSDGENKKIALTSVSLWKNNISSKMTPIFADLLERKTCCLQSLDLSENHLGSEGTKILARALGVNRSLLHLNLTNNSMGTDGAKSIGDALIQNTTLQSLKLAWNQIQDSGVEAIATGATNHPALTELDLRWNGIATVGFQALREMLRDNKILTSLQLVGGPSMDFARVQLQFALLLDRNRKEKKMKETQVLAEELKKKSNRW